MMDLGSSSSHILRKKNHRFTEDRISSLPKIAIDAILICLPIKEAARTSILSRSWRYEWTNLSHLVFNCDELTKYYDDETLDGDETPDDGDDDETPDDGDDDEIAYIVDQVLLFHQGPIHKFQLSFISRGIGKYIHRWLLFLSRNGVREFTLHRARDAFRGVLNKIPSCLFSCKELVYLELSWCELTLPSSFRGFSNLKTLHLCGVNFRKSSLEKLITMCPLLVKLELYHIYGCPNLTICALNLVEIKVESELKYLCFEKTSVLAKVFVNLLPDYEKEYQPTANGPLCKLTTLLCCLPGIRRLMLARQTYQILSGGEVPVTLLANCQLSYLSIGINFEDREQLSTVFWIFRSCPLLREVDIEMQSTVNEQTEDLFVDFISWDRREDCDLKLNHLKILRLSDYSGTKAELRFVEFVLANAPGLEMVHIELKKDFEEMDLLKDLLQLRRISSKSQIVIPK